MADRCEGCEAPATGRDADGVPLCHECGAECETAPSRSEFTPELLAEIVETPSVVMLIDEDVIAEIARQALAAQEWREKASEVPGLSATLDEARAQLAEARAKLAERERYIAEQRAITEPSVQDLARQLREATERAEKAERERDEAVSVRREMRVAWDGASDQRNDLRADLAAMTERAERAERERDALKLVASDFARRHVESNEVVIAAVVRELDEARARLAAAERERDEARDLLIAQAEGCISFAWTDDADGRNCRSDVPYFAAQVAVPLRDFFRALREWTAIDALRAKLTEVERDLDEAIEDRKVARDDAARAAAMLTARRIELDEARAQLRETTQERDAEADCCTEMRRRAKGFV